MALELETPTLLCCAHLALFDLLLHTVYTLLPLRNIPVPIVLNMKHIYAMSIEFAENIIPTVYMSTIAHRTT